MYVGELALWSQFWSKKHQTTTKIGTSEKNKLRWSFKQKLNALSVTSQAPTVESITKLDATNMDTEKTFKGGCKFLLDWFNSKLT